MRNLSRRIAKKELEREKNDRFQARENLFPLQIYILLRNKPHTSQLFQSQQTEHPWFFKAIAVVASSSQQIVGLFTLVEL